MLDVAAHVELELYPWQQRSLRYLSALSPTIGWLWPEVAILAARQNGKTTILELLILTRLVAGQRVMHSAQNRELPRESHIWLGDTLSRFYPELLGRNAVRSSSGQESITLRNGGHYRIAAATRRGARGPSNDLVAVDEVLELDNFDFLAAAKPTTQHSLWPQVAYFSNAGTPESVVLASLRLRADSDQSLAYLEWSAAPDDDPGDPRAWAKANPTIGHFAGSLPNLEREYRANLLGNTMDIWEREYLCRWTPSAGTALLLQPDEWARNDFSLADDGRRVVFGIKVDPDGSRASIVAAWQLADDRIALDVIGDVTGEPIETRALGLDLRAVVKERKARKVIYDPWTDADLARYVRSGTAVGGRDYASATEKFVALAQSRQLVIRDPQGIIERDLEHTVKSSSRAGTYQAVKDSPESTNTALEAAIRAVWIASAPQPRAVVH
jgi:hypothetical protein